MMRPVAKTAISRGKNSVGARGHCIETVRRAVLT